MSDIKNNPLNDIDAPSLTDGIESPVSCWWLHRWGKWEDTKVGNIVRGDITVGRYKYQERHCTRCNKSEITKVSTQT